MPWKKRQPGRKCLQFQEIMNKWWKVVMTKMLNVLLIHQEISLTLRTMLHLTNFQMTLWIIQRIRTFP
uniref:Uncharacterized protein n=1 Tax=Arundo donax TaxID=35708 RepID=A0A0A9D3I3_ARUDO